MRTIGQDSQVLESLPGEVLAAADVLPAQVEGQGAELAHLPHHGRAEQGGEG